MLRSLFLLSGLAAGWISPAVANPPPDVGSCVPIGMWMDPAKEDGIADEALYARMARRPVVLLAESHTSAEHHRWQLHAIAALHARESNMVLGFEMFPRRVQPILDRWVAGALTREAFLEAVEWDTVWGYDQALYMPLFDFARMHRLPMAALNVDKALVSRVRQEGWPAIPADDREGIGDPAPAGAGYLSRLGRVFAAHAGSDVKVPEPDDSDFRRFVEAQLTWDRAMAEALAGARGSAEAPLVVGIVGKGHAEYGDGIPHQLADLGIANAAVLLPWDTNRPCEELAPKNGPAVAEAVFGLAEIDEPKAPARPLLGVFLEDGEGSVKITKVVAESVAEKAGLKAGDRIVEAAGTPMSQVKDVIKVVRRQAFGSWLPMIVEQDGENLEIIAKFPPPT
jgi:uncharacterized iron-regulated protein